MHRFFLTGLPRSRTAWLAALFSTGESICWHDALLLCRSVGDLPKLFGSVRCAGDSDSGLILFHSDVVTLFPDAPWVVVERDPDEAFRSMVARFGRDLSNGGWPLLVAALRRIPRDDSVLRVRYEDLDEVRVMRKIWKHLLPSTKFDEARWRFLKRVKVERIPPKSDPIRHVSLAHEVLLKGRILR